MGTAINCYAQKAKIQLNLKKDSTYYLDQTSTAKVTQEISGHSQVINTIISSKVAHKVVAVSDTSYVISVRYEKLFVHSTSGVKVLMDVNTDDTSKQDIMNKVMRGILNRPITMAINKMGKVLEIKDLDKLDSGIVGNLSNLSTEQRAQVLAQIKQSFGEKAFRSNFQDAFAVFPASQVSVNDKWQAATTMELIIHANINTTYLLKEITNKSYIIHGDAAITPAGNGDYVIMYNVPVRYINVTGNYSVDIILDRVAGWVKEERITKLIKGSTDIKDNPRQPGGMVFPMSVEYHINLTDK